MFIGQIDEENIEFKRGKDRKKRKRRTDFRRKAKILKRKLAENTSKFKEKVSGRTKNLLRGAVGSVRLEAGKINRSIQDTRNKVADFYVKDGQAEMKAGGYFGSPSLTRSGIIKTKLGRFIGTKAKSSEVLGKSSRKRKKSKTNYGYLPGELEQIKNNKRIIS